MSLKLLPAALLLFVVFAAGLGQTVRTADAVVTGDPVPDSNQMTSGQAPIEVVVPLDGGNEDVTVSVTGFDQPNLTGMLVVVECSPNPPDCPADLGEFTSSDADQIIVQSDGITEIILSLALTCTAEGTVTITASTVAPASSESVDVSCSPTGGGNGGGDDDHQVEVGGVYQVVATANPNILPCEGGTTTITAELVDSFGNVLANTEFRFFTTAGEIVQTSPTTAELTLGPNQYFAEVTATIPDEFDLEDVHIDEAITTVGLTCTDENLDQVLVVTANPNVIDCTGTTTLTASVRDRNGHVVPGRGFHFVTSAGLLTVSPNNASNEEGVATLSLRPGDGNATVAVSSGPLHGTFEELDGSEDIEDDFVIDETAMVTVIQNCLGTTTGQIRVNSSAQTVACGENVFIGLSVIDEDIQTVVDQTPMTLIASAGGFYGGVREDGTQNLLPAAQVPTSHGEANTIFYAPLNFHGEVKITAASGDAYGFTKLNVTCVVAPATGTGSGTGSANGGAAPPCIDIGDGVCITPPNTGRNQITPPSTGDAGLK